MRRYVLSLFFATIALTAQARPTHTPVPASASATDALTPAEARQALDVLSDEHKRAEVINTLRAVAKASLIIDASAPAAASASAVAASAPARISPFTSNSLIAAMLQSSENWIKTAAHEAQATAHAALQISALSYWFEGLMQSPRQPRPVTGSSLAAYRHSRRRPRCAMGGALGFA